MLSLLAKLPLYRSFYHFGFPKVLPFSVVVSLSYRCNSTCATCDVWKKPNDDMTPAEWRQVFRHLGHTPFYMTFTGGEPFLRADMHEIVIAGYQECMPEVITIPTNGILTKRILDRVAQICDAAPKAKIGINLSLDGVGADHDEIRGVPGNWKKSMQTWQGLKELQKTRQNLVLTVHTVLSKFNIQKAAQIYDGLQFLQPDSYITEVAEERVELDTLGWGITPLASEYAPVADFLSLKAREWPARGIARVTQSFRAQYYQLAKRTLIEQKQVIPCLAGWASAHLAPNGDVWSCCIRAEAVANLRDHDYDLRPVWFEHQGRLRAMRRSIKNRECSCPMANASYANMLLHPPTLARVGRDVLLKKPAAASASRRTASRRPRGSAAD
jgi:MoaA/NifB/PqqE/SkfB family radical SAM enzyme